MGLSRPFGILCLLVLGGCSGLTAPKPLFGAADQGEPPIVEGMWTARAASGEQAPLCDDAARIEMRPCYQVAIRREKTGLWRYHSVERESGGKLSETEQQFALVPINADAPSAYLLEIRDRSPGTNVVYSAIVPVGARPAREIIVIAYLDCEAVLGAGPVAGIVETHAAASALDESNETPRKAWLRNASQPEQTLARHRSCEATTQGGAREAARRVVSRLVDNPENMRLVFVRP
ncbi:MAG TPA: hypothetical protein VG841_04550 [Caulobacterales bacterium]|nr:hypothetical protein [Caulobacterales bacterium]